MFIGSPHFLRISVPVKPITVWRSTFKVQRSKFTVWRSPAFVLVLVLDFFRAHRQGTLRSPFADSDIQSSQRNSWIDKNDEEHERSTADTSRQIRTPTPRGLTLIEIASTEET